ncbi:autotransporter outer membrane beta-barrel domain-containing protein [Stappia stellulata]|uniref:autotransporter outer membrane beta-barrel domain-containing protein n=1 Tax=Stappia stellulata TaxID=71235 RepID=UPI0003FCF098|nr:autotransporter outer membrane beta-barrel domain-containing protein [Stappia stellulata]
MTRLASVSSVCPPRDRVSFRPLALPLAVALLSATALTPAEAGCSIDNKVETCSGEMNGAIVHDQNGVHTLTLKGLTNDLNAYESPDAGKQDGPAMYLRDPGGTTDAPDDWSGSNRNGQSGVDGDAGATIDATVSLDSGFGFVGTSGVVIETTGWEGSYGHEAKHTDKHATGGRGGDGGEGGTVSFIAQSDSGGKTPSAIQANGTQSSSASVQDAVRGIQLMTTGGAGGNGGWAESKGGLKDAEGGVGGTGGNGGAATLSLKDGHYLTYNSDGTALGGVGIHVSSQGGRGGGAGYGEVDGWDADSAYGGNGGDGGNGGTVNVSASSALSTIVTTGPVGIYITSIGGGGGDGGDGKGGHDYAGDGGDAGNGGSVTADLKVDVTTKGDGSGPAIYLKSAGGQAGDSGGDHGGIKNHSGNPGEPGEAGTVDLTLTGSTVNTSAEGADGVLLQSVGGMGGNGGDVSGVFSYGSKGGSGGAGGKVTATVTSTDVTTKGDHASAFHAQSIGGGGGKAGKTSGLSALAAEAGAGGVGGTVNVSLAGSTFATEGVNATAIKVQSIGGGGGSSGASDGFYAVGGNAGLGGKAGTATLTVDGVTATTKGDASVGILVESIGAGGGDAYSPSGAFAYGQDGGGGGNGDTVTFTSKGKGVSVTTEGDHADGIMLQSLGGGGGKGASSFEAIALLQPLVGTSGGGGGSGGDVTFTGSDKDVIKTSGDHSRGFFAQSVGGGGGAGGNTVEINVGLMFNPQTGSQGSDKEHHGGTVSGTIGGTIETDGHNSAGAFVQSVGGGGGSAGNSVQVGVAIEFNHDMGADGDKGGTGGTVDFTSNAAITTKGHDSDGILAQSVGGGGGHSSNVFDSNLAGLNLSQFVGNQGAQGGAGGDGGKVTVVSNGTIATGGHMSLGILAQSVGGGGGKAGSTINADVGLSAGAVTLGQSGGDGGVSGDVSVTSKAKIWTKGASATGILAQSVAGGGGVANTTVNGDLGISMDYTHGGNGGQGGDAGNVSVENDAEVQTDGDGSVAIFAQSLGGGGGNGAVTASGAVSVVDVNIGVGGNGGEGGTGGTVNVSNAGKLTTKGDHSSAVLAQSVGGSGGNAGMLAMGSATAGEISGSVNVGVGGDGGDGGIADAVKIDNSAAIETSGYMSFGLAAQSVGGDGGMGGAVYAGTFNASMDGGATVAVTVGGSGGGGSKAGAVTINNNGAITTSGHYADAIFAQSVGGNGGAGGVSYAGTLDVSTGSSFESSVQVGGNGGSGALASDVKVTNTKALATTGGNAHGIFAQSVGGDGGDGGSGIGFFGDFERQKENYLKVTANAQVGGGGGSGNHAGKVTVDNSGDISTAQDTSYGVYAQSVGGGGGDGGNAGAYSIGYTLAPKNEEGESAESKGVSLSFTMGGSGGGGGHGDTVDVTNHKQTTITTSGKASYAIFAQSVGGSGGTGGNGEPGLEGWLADVYEIYEKLNTAKEIYEQFKEFPESLYEGFSVDVGGGAGEASDGGAVTVTNDGYLTTSGDSATAIYAQSVGGGGGTGGDGSQGLITSLSVAGSSGGGGHGGTINVSNSGTITTDGDGAMGILAQSQGGGGGAAGDIETTIVHEIDDLWETLGAQVFSVADGGKGGDGGDVSVSSKGTILTNGANAHGIFAYSVGGGGGAEGELEAGDGSGSIGSEGRDGLGGEVSVNVLGLVDVTGDGSVGVYAQSVSGGGESYSKGVDITVDGTVRAEGAKGRAILAQASSFHEHDPDGNNHSEGVVAISIGPRGLVETTSSDAYETIAVMGGRSVSNSEGDLIVTNQITNGGTLRSADLDSVVVRNDQKASLKIVNNGGKLTGSLDLNDANKQAFYNIESGVTELGTSFNMGIHADSLFANSAVLTAGEWGKVHTSTITTGRFTSSDLLIVDAAQATDGTITNDLIIVDVHGKDDVIELGGTVETQWSKSTTLTSGDTGSLKFFTSANGETIDWSDAQVRSNGVIAYTLDGSDDEVFLDYSVDYQGGASGMGRNAANTAQYFENAMNQIKTAGMTDDTSGGVREFGSTLLNSGNTAETERHFNSLSPEESLNGAMKAVAASQALHGLLQSCPTLDPGMGDAFFRQRECVWVQAIGNRHHQSATSTTDSFLEVTTGVAGAFQKEVFDSTFVEVGGQLEYLDVTSGTYSQSGSRFSAGVALKHEVGMFTFSTTVGGGVYDLDQNRRYAIGGTGHTASANIKGRFLTAEGRVSAVFERHGFYAKPAVALSVTRLWQDAFRETGSGPLNWNVRGVSKTSVAAAPILEIGHAFDLQDRPTVVFLRGGITAQLTDPSVSTTAVLAGADASFGSLSSVSSSDRVRADFAAGFDMDVSERFSVSLLGQAGFSENTTDLGGYARMKLRF